MPALGLRDEVVTFWPKTGGSSFAVTHASLVQPKSARLQAMRARLQKRAFGGGTKPQQPRVLPRSSHQRDIDPTLVFADAPAKVRGGQV